MTSSKEQTLFVLQMANDIQDAAETKTGYHMPNSVAEEAAEVVSGINIDDAFQDYMLGLMQKHPA